MILRLPHHRYTTSPTMQRIPDFEQYTFAILSPLMIPDNPLPAPALRGEEEETQRFLKPFLFNRVLLIDY